MTFEPFTKKQLKEVKKVRTEGLTVMAERNGEQSIAALALRLLATALNGVAETTEEEKEEEDELTA